MGKKTVFILITLLLVALVLTGCPPKTTEDTDTTDTDTTMEETKETYKIGVVLSKTGNYAGLGGPENNVIEMEVENVNNAGGINGYQLEVIIEDDETDADKANKAATKLIESDGVICILGTSGSGESLAIAAVASGTVPQVALGGANVLSNPVKEWLFQIPWPARLVVEPV
ncbi:MAG: ABC transporter substrate-binding protein, partial [Actinomycetia bacterium]|nr:ABC transporter substrate-binding protein [Actinomycetes bacterium]